MGPFGGHRRAVIPDGQERKGIEDPPKPKTHPKPLPTKGGEEQIGGNP